MRGGVDAAVSGANGTERVKAMKQFIYLDTDMVNSIMAQKEKGLLLEQVREQEHTSGDESKKFGNIDIDGSISGGFWKLAQAQAELSGSGGLESSKHAQTVLKEIATKTLHDAAFDVAYEEIKDECASNEDKHAGSFIKIDGAFEFVDLLYLENLFSEEGVLTFFKKGQKAEIEQQFTQNKISTSTSGKKPTSEEKRQLKQQLDAIDTQYNEISDTVNTIRKIIPYDRMLVSNGYMIPLENQYFRDNPETMGFKHGGDVTCVGYITNVIKSNELENDEANQNIFVILRNMVNQVLSSILEANKDELLVVHPIAIYYGN